MFVMHLKGIQPLVQQVKVKVSLQFFSLFLATSWFWDHLFPPTAPSVGQ